MKKRKNTNVEKSQKVVVTYAGFWSRVAAFVTDIFMIGIPISILSMAIFGYSEIHSAGAMDVIVGDEKAQTNPPNPLASIFQISLFLISFVWFWYKSGQTPGKKMAKIRVVDATTFERASILQLIVRFFGYFLSLITIIGFFIGLFRRDKRTLHDLISRTAVIYES